MPGARQQYLFCSTPYLRRFHVGVRRLGLALGFLELLPLYDHPPSHDTFQSGFLSQDVSRYLSPSYSPHRQFTIAVGIYPGLPSTSRIAEARLASIPLPMNHNTQTNESEASLVEGSTLTYKHFATIRRENLPISISIPVPVRTT